MRGQFVKALHELMQEDERIMLLTGDLGFNMLEPIRDSFPKQFINCGIMEQTMMGIAAGLAINGAIPFVYSIANFPTIRCLEQIRNDVIYHQLPVKIVMYGGPYEKLGYTHEAGDEFHIMCCFNRDKAQIEITTPYSPEDTYFETRRIAYSGLPAYMRLFRA